MCFSTGVARAIRALSPIVHFRGPVVVTRQRSSMQGMDNLDISSLPSVGSQSPLTGSIDAAPSRRRSDWQLLTAHENGQMQVWEASTGMLCPVLRIGTAGPAARCVFVHVCTTWASAVEAVIACSCLHYCCHTLKGCLPCMHCSRSCGVLDAVLAHAECACQTSDFESLTEG